MIKFEDARVGQKVKYNGKWSTIGVCNGFITELFPSHPDDCVCVLGYAIVKIDEPLPKHWPYTDNTFAPALNDLEIIK